MSQANRIQQKLKTLPNELTTQPEQFAFKSACQELNSCTSPTFASTDKVLMEWEQGKQRKELGEIQLVLAQNHKLVEKYKRIEEQYKKLYHKYEVCSKNLGEKLSKSVKKMYSKNSCEQDDEAIDLILELKAMAQEVKSCKNRNKILNESNQHLEKNISELQILLQNYKNKNERLEGEIKNASKGKSQQNIIRELEEKLHKERQQKEKMKKKSEQQYEKLHFLKKQIEKKRQEDLKHKEDLENELKRTKQSSQALEMTNKELSEKINTLQNQIKHINDLTTEENKSIMSLFEQEKSNTKKLQKQLLKIQRELQQQKELFTEKSSEALSISKRNYDLEGSNKYLENRIEELQRQVDDTEVECQTLKQQYECWVEERQKSRAQIQNETQSLKNIIEEMEKQNKELSNTKIELQMQNKLIRQTKDSLQQSLVQKTQQIQEISNKISHMQETHHHQTHYEPLYQAYNKKPLSTKILSHLKMIASTLGQILGYQEFELYSMRMQNKEEIESVVGQMVGLMEEAADYFDDLNERSRGLQCEVKNKEEIIVTLLKFTPEQKKNKIIEYLNVMQSKEDQGADRVYKATCQIIEQAEDWKNKLSILFKNLNKAEQQLCTLRKRMKTIDCGSIKKYQQENIEPYYLRKEAYPRKQYQHPVLKRKINKF